MAKNLGFVGKLSRGVVSGWVKSKSHHDPVNVNLKVNEELISTVTADQYRKDLKEKGIHPSGECGFTFILPIDLDVLNDDVMVFVDQEEIPRSVKLIENLRTISAKSENPYSQKNDSPQFFFIHIPKTAGTSFRNMLYRMFPQDKIYPNAKDIKQNNNLYPNFSEILRLPFEKIDNLSLLMGHYPFITEKIFEKEPKKIIFLRDPVKRLISHIFHIKRTSEQLKGATPTDIYYKMKSKLVNLQTKYLSNNFNENLNFTPSLEDAKANLKKCEFVGITEEFSLSVKLIEKKFNWNLGEALKVNTRTNLNNDKVPKAFLNELTQDNEIDIALYKFSKTLFYDEKEKVEHL